MAIEAKSMAHQIPVESMEGRSGMDESDPLAAIHEIAKDMHAAGGISEQTMRVYDELRASPRLQMHEDS
ncbi:hypothetical protein C266_10014 [Pandoraea sp. SD6-2]|nr:hypothetical protein C266_10014 [Pandoraea sp. SD6-2]